MSEHWRKLDENGELKKFCHFIAKFGLNLVLLIKFHIGDQGESSSSYPNPVSISMPIFDKPEKVDNTPSCYSALSPTAKFCLYFTGIVSACIIFSFLWRSYEVTYEYQPSDSTEWSIKQNHVDMFIDTIIKEKHRNKDLVEDFIYPTVRPKTKSGEDEVVRNLEFLKSLSESELAEDENEEKFKEKYFKLKESLTLMERRAFINHLNFMVERDLQRLKSDPDKSKDPEANFNKLVKSYAQELNDKFKNNTKESIEEMVKDMLLDHDVMKDLKSGNQIIGVSDPVKMNDDLKKYHNQHLNTIFQQIFKDLRHLNKPDHEVDVHEALKNQSSVDYDYGKICKQNLENVDVDVPFLIALIAKVLLPIVGDNNELLYFYIENEGNLEALKDSHKLEVHAAQLLYKTNISQFFEDLDVVITILEEDFCGELDKYSKGNDTSYKPTIGLQQIYDILMSKYVLAMTDSYRWIFDNFGPKNQSSSLEANVDYGAEGEEYLPSMADNLELERLYKDYLANENEEDREEYEFYS